MPVVDMNHVWPEVEWAQQFERGSAEIDEASVIVPKAIHAFAPEELLVLDEVDGDVIANPTLEHVGGHRLMCQRHGQALDDMWQTVLLAIHAAVARHPD